MKKLVLGLSASLFSIFLSFENNVYACTDFRLTAKDGTVIVTRSLEFAQDLKSELRSSNRDRVFSMAAPNGKPGLYWKAKYGYVFLDALNADVAMDGMNEQGLSVEILYLPGYAKYQAVPANEETKVLPYAHFGDWVLSNFKTIDEVRAALPNVYVVQEKTPGFGDTIFPVHYAIYDASGNGLVVEYVDGKMHVYDNKIGIMTNSPTYDWHLHNLANYTNLAPVNPPEVIDNGEKFGATGQGFGMLGLPGDISPPSRFVKTAVLTRTAIPAADAVGELNLAEHIINNVDIPLGLARELQKGNQPTNDVTQWVVFKDLTNKKLYYRTYNDLTLRFFF